MTNLKNELKKYYLFQDLSDSELAQVAEISEIRHYEIGQHLFNQDDAPEAIYAIQFGSVRAEAFSESNHDLGFGLLSNGSMLGENSLQSLSTRSVSAVVTEALTAIRIPYAGLTRATEANHELGFKIYRALSRHLGHVFHRSMGELSRLRERHSKL